MPPGAWGSGRARRLRSRASSPRASAANRSASAARPASWFIRVHSPTPVRPSSVRTRRKHQLVFGVTLTPRNSTAAMRMAGLLALYVRARGEVAPLGDVGADARGEGDRKSVV